MKKKHKMVEVGEWYWTVEPPLKNPHKVTQVFSGKFFCSKCEKESWSLEEMMIEECKVK